jgi:DNA-binding winged helix-turn-helix (wHTH) protein/Tfp pilus assembly protein PilF
MNGQIEPSRSDRIIAGLILSPGRRRLRGPGGEVALEPLVVQFLLLLAEANEEVVPRRAIFERLWGAAQVGDDSLNRVAAALRRALNQASGGFVGIETIPRTGYRLTGNVGSVRPRRWRRRTILAGATAAAAAAVGGVGLWALSRRPDSKSEEMLREGEQILRYELPGTEERARGVLRAAIEADPQNALAWGLLAYSLANELDDETSSRTVDKVSAADKALTKALELDSKEPNALLARYIVDGSLNDWIPADQRLRSILRLDPENTFAISRLATVLQAAGFTRESFSWTERFVAANPMSPNPHYRRALQLWIIGETAKADAVVDRALEHWPDHRWVWNARFIIYAFTGRARAALAMLRDAETRPKSLSSEVVRTWGVSLAALASPSPATITEATSVNLAAAREAPGLAAFAVMSLSALGQVDPAFEIANGFLSGRGGITTRRSDRQGAYVATRGWRRTQWLFTPPLAPMRADARFLPLCRDIGLDQYWAYRGRRPDYLSAAS